MGERDIAGSEVSAILAALSPGTDRLLEIGCGQGRITRPLVEHGLVVDAVDIDRSALAHAAKHVGRSRRARFHTKVPSSPRRWPAILFSHSL